MTFVHQLTFSCWLFALQWGQKRVGQNFQSRCTIRESNPGQLLGRQLCYHYTNGAVVIFQDVVAPNTHTDTPNNTKITIITNTPQHIIHPQTQNVLSAQKFTDPNTPIVSHQLIYFHLTSNGLHHILQTCTTGTCTIHGNCDFFTSKVTSFSSNINSYLKPSSMRTLCHD